MHIASIVLICAIVLPWHTRAQSVVGHDNADASPSSIEDFLDQARSAAERFRDPDTATLAGYRLLGPDFPGMGYHWINVRHLGTSAIDPLKPSVLTYLNVEGKLVLTGVAFAVAIRSEDDLPAFPYAGAWHMHHGTVDEETLILNPASRRHAEPSGWRLAMLHAWVFTENPAGVFAQDNWTLPFYRAGLTPPKHVTPQQGKALHLIAGGEEYYLRLIETARPLREAHRSHVARILRQYSQAIRSLVGHMQYGAVATEDFLAELESVWAGLWRDIRAAVPDDDWSEIAMLSG